MRDTQDRQFAKTHGQFAALQKPAVEARKWSGHLRVAGEQADDVELDRIGRMSRPGAWHLFAWQAQ